MKRFKPYAPYLFIFLLATGLTLASLLYVRPANCTSFCGEAIQAKCPPGSCLAGEQRAGFPLPVRIDDPGGGSPTSGWGILGPEDLPNPFTFLLDVAFYSLLLWGGWHILTILTEKWKSRRSP